MFSLLMYIMLIPVKLAHRARLRQAHHTPSAVEVVAPKDPSPETIIAMAEGAQQAHDTAVAVDVLFPATDRQVSKLADIVDAVGPHAEQAPSVALVGATAHESNAVISMHFKPTEEEE